MQRRPAPLSRRAFTLVEVLVVTVIVAIVAGLLVPVILNAREKARAIVCIVNEKQIGLALTLYLQDFDETYPQEHPFSSNPVFDDDHGQLESVDYGTTFSRLLPYVSAQSSSNSGIYICPSDPDPHGLRILDQNGDCRDTGAPPPGPLTSYLVNAYFIFGATLSQVDAPEQSIFVAERRDDFCDVHYHPWLQEANVPLVANDTINPVSIAAQRHSEGSNYLFADGHAHWQRFADTRVPFEGHELFGEHQAF